MRARDFFSILLGERLLKRCGRLSFEGDARFRNDQSPDSAPLLTLICFSYLKDFATLKTSLASLRRACPGIAFNYVLVSDRKAPFTDAHLSVLEETLARPIEHWTTPFRHGSGGLRVFVNELDAFWRLAAQLDGRAWITKLDSDVLFLDRQYFDFLCSDREHDHVFQDARTTLGGRSRPWPSYAQGGCYSFRADLFRRACQVPALRSFWVALGKFGKKGALGGLCTLAEDFLMYFHVARFAERPLSTTFFVACPLRRQARGVSPPRFPSLMHFERCGAQMADFYTAWLRQNGVAAKSSLSID